MEFETDEVRPGKGRADAMDVHVGSRIRQRRNALRMSQEQLAEKLGLTFQQVQKYERGANRVAASRLWDIGRLLQVPISYFYEDAPVAHAVLGMAENQDGFDDPLSDLMRRTESQALVRAYWRIADPTVRQRMLELIRSMAPAENGSA